MYDVIEKNLSEEFSTAARADQKGVNILILRNINPIKRLDGEMADYSLEHQWLRDMRDITSVLGSEYSYWQKKEINWKECLFDQVNLF